MRKILRSVLLAVASLTTAGMAAAAPSINLSDACVGQSGFEFVVEFNDVGLTDVPLTDVIIFRIDAESNPFVVPTERISINFTVAGDVDFAQVETIGSPPPSIDRWQDGVIPAGDFTITDLGGGSRRVEGRVPHGTEPLVVSDDVAYFAVRTSFGTTFAINAPVAACADVVPSFVSEVNLSDGVSWSPNVPGDTVATNGDGVVLEPDQPIDVTMSINLNGVDAWRCTEVFVVDGIFVSETVNHADSTGAGPAFANFPISAPPATGIYDMVLTGYPNDDCTGPPIATLTLLPGPSLASAVEVIPPSVAIIDPTATIGNNVTFGGTVTIEAGAIIGDRVALGDAVVVGRNTIVQADAILDDGTTIGANSSIGAAARLTFVINGIFTPTTIGKDVIIGSNAVVVGANIKKNADIGAGAEIRSIINGIFAPSSVGRNASVGDGSKVIGSIVRKGAVIGSNVEIRYVVNGIFVPSTIGRNALVGDGSVIGGTFIKNGATLATGVSTATGTRIGHRASVGVDSGFGSHATIKRNAIVGDDVQAGDNLVIRKGVVLGNNIVIGNNVDLGKNSSVGDNVTIGNDVTVSPGANVPDGTLIPDGMTYP
jgi:UDP-3-O-[3-hydroxymyristoyl] glucosamine N-acyltransferase